MTLTNCISFFLGILTTAKTVNEGLRVWAAIFKVFTDGATVLRNTGA